MIDCGRAELTSAGQSGSPAQHLESNTCSPVADEAERFRRGARQIDDDPVALRTAGRTSIDDSYTDGSPIPQVRDADEGPERIGGMRSDHGMRVESDAAGGRLSFETRTVICG